jgi:uncharacterized repeat protein (TIGR04076 family)
MTDEPEANDGDRFALYDLRVTVDRIQGRSVCGLTVGDYFELTSSSMLRIPAGKHFCVYALACVVPFLGAIQRSMDGADWLAREHLFACPDPDERLIMRVERTGRRTLARGDLT